MAESYADAVEAYRQGVHGPVTSPMQTVLYMYDKGRLTDKDALMRLDALDRVTRKPGEK